jgi:N-hydroxyarylamine O-acetyltransferase
MPGLEDDNVDRYLERIGLDPEHIRAGDRDVETLARLQRAHVTSVPFENLAIVGDPFGDEPGAGVTLAVEALFEKIVERRRGGYCFELNGLFTVLLESLGYDVHRAAAMIVPDDGPPRVPANHHVIIASLDQRYVVDVGMGSPQMHRPTPLSGTETPANGAGVSWHVVANDRPRYDLTTEYRVGDGDWQTRYVFDTTPRALSYFEAPCDYLASAPESPFTGDPVVRIETKDGWTKLGSETLTRVVRGEPDERPIPSEDWPAVLDREFGLSVPE